MSSLRPLRLLTRPTTAMVALFGLAALVVQPNVGQASAPAGCAVVPRPAVEFVLPAADSSTVTRVLVMFEDETQLPEGTPATAAEAAAAQAFADLYTACQNAGDLRRLTALYSDAMFKDSLAVRLPLRLPPENSLEALVSFLFDPVARDRSEAAEQLAQDVATPPKPLSEPINEAEVRDVRVLPDGRLGAVLVQDGRPTEFQMYVRVDGRLLLDARMDIHQTPS